MQATEYQNREKRDSQLWWLAVIVIVLLAVAVLLIDTSHNTDDWVVSPQLELVLDLGTVRVSLVLAVLLICAYFRDCARRLRQQNHELITSLAEYSKQLERKNYEVSRLKELSDQLIGITDVQVAMDMVLDTAIEVVGADTASIMLREKGQGTLKIVASQGLPPDVVASNRVRIGESIAGRVVEDGIAVIVNSDDMDDDMARRAKRGDTIVSSIIVPIHVGDEIRGVVSTAKRRGGVCFSEEDMGVLCTIANQASLAIQKTDLLDDLRDQVEALAANVKKLRLTQAELMQSEKMASIGLLAGGAAHEINNPLQVILGRTELLLAREHDDITERDLKVILEHTSRIAYIVSNLLSFSRRSEDGDFRLLDVNDVLKRTLSLLEPQMVTDDVAVVRELQTDLPTVYGNASQLQQVFTNIILNAYQAMRTEGGSLTVKTTSSAIGVDVEFADTGPGIAPEHLAHILEPFFTTKEEGEGTGLGLAIAYGILQSHEGNIRVQSSPGMGTVFSVTLPVRGEILDAEVNTKTKEKQERRKAA